MFVVDSTSVHTVVRFSFPEKITDTGYQLQMISSDVRCQLVIVANKGALGTEN